MGPIKVKKPQAIFFDLSGTATKSYFTDKILFPYIKLNCATYLHNSWDNPILQRDIERLREQSKQDSGPVVANHDCDRRQIEDSVCQYVFRCLEDLRNNEAINVFRLHMWFDGYHRNKIETPVYSDVAIQIKHWRISMKIKLYVLSNGWIEATKRFMAKTNHGDLNLLIDGHFDTTFGSLDQAETFRKVVNKIQLQPEQVLFLTKAPSECRAAKEAGLNAILVMTHRRDLLRLNENEKKEFLYVRSFNEITFFDDKQVSYTSGTTSNLNESTCNTGAVAPPHNCSSPTLSHTFAPSDSKSKYIKNVNENKLQNYTPLQETRQSSSSFGSSTMNKSKAYSNESGSKSALSLSSSPLSFSTTGSRKKPGSASSTFTKVSNTILSKASSSAKVFNNASSKS